MSAIDWPTVGSRYVDSTGRTLRVTAIEPGSKAERHVQGEVLGRPYACDLRTFDAIWRAGALDEAGVLLRVPQVAVSAAVETHQARTPLYTSDGKALPYTRRS